MKILIIEDDKKIAGYIAKGTREAGFNVDLAEDGNAGLAMVLGEVYDVAIIDLMLPGIDGLSLIRRMRAAKVKTPVIILSAKRSVDDRVKGLEAGGDDYLTKPFSFSELLARVYALIRRDTKEEDPTTISVEDVTLDLFSRKVTRNGELVELQPREFSLLEFLMRNRDRVLSRTSILDHVYDYRFDPQTNIVDVLVSRLRNKIDKGFDCQRIHTVRGVGYVFKTE